MFQHQRLEVPCSRTLEGPVCSDIQGFKDLSEGSLSKSILTIIKFFTSDLSQSFSNSALLIFCADLFFFMNTYTVQGTTYSSISGPPPWSLHCGNKKGLQVLSRVHLGGERRCIIACNWELLSCFFYSGSFSVFFCLT